MTSPKECRERFEDIMALVMNELASEAVDELSIHVANCTNCRNTRDALVVEERELRDEFDALASGLFSDKVSLIQTNNVSSSSKVTLPNHRLNERIKTMILSHKRLSLAAASMVTAVAASLILYVALFLTDSQAYALEQTAQANRQVTSYHVRITPAAELGEVWVEVNPDGSPRRARMDLLSPDDGAKVVILTDGKAEAWLKAKNVHLSITAKDALNDFMAKRSIFDPKLAFEELQTKKKENEVQVETQEPAKDGEPITLTVTSHDTPDRKSVYEVDPASKLVKRLTQYRRTNGEWSQVELREYLAYNMAIDPKVFQLDLPKDVIRVDKVNQTVGLAKGQLTDDEIATKVAKEFVTAVIADDFEKAGAIYSGMPAATLKQRFEQAQVKFLRLISVGTPSENARTKSVLVPVTVELEINGQKIVKELLPSSRAVEGQPDRWELIGGI